MALCHSLLFFGKRISFTVGEKGKDKKDPFIRSKTETHPDTMSEYANIVTKPFYHCMGDASASLRT